MYHDFLPPSNMGSYIKSDWHPSAAQDHHSQHPSTLTSVYQVPALHLIPLWYLKWLTHPFSPDVQTLSILWSTDSPTPFLCQLFYAPLHSYSAHSWHSNQTSQTLHFKNIYFPSLSTSYSSSSALYNAIGSIIFFSFRHFFVFIPNPLLQRAHFSKLPHARFIPLIHSVYHISFTSSATCELTYFK